MNRLLYTAVLLVGFTPVFALAQSEFRATASGTWNNNSTWAHNVSPVQTDEASVWLAAETGIFPGERHNRNVDVTIDGGSTVVIEEGQEIHIRSLSIISGKLEVHGRLIVGESENDVDVATDRAATISEQTSFEHTQAPSLEAAPEVASAPGLQLLQNHPNPVMVSDQTTFNFHIDAAYSIVRLALYDELGREVAVVYNERNPTTGWHTLSFNTTSLVSGSYQVVLQAGSTVLHRSMSVVK